jgi:hypothetical protein
MNFRVRLLNGKLLWGYTTLHLIVMEMMPQPLLGILLGGPAALGSIDPATPVDRTGDDIGDLLRSDRLAALATGM